MLFASWFVCTRTRSCSRSLLGLFLVFSLIAKRNEDGGSAPSPSGGDVVSSAYCHEALAVVFQDLAWGKAET